MGARVGCALVTSGRYCVTGGDYSPATLAFEGRQLKVGITANKKGDRRGRMPLRSRRDQVRQHLQISGFTHVVALPKIGEGEEDAPKGRYGGTWTVGFFTLPQDTAKIATSVRRKCVTIRAKSDGQLARVATNLAIGVVGLVMVRLIALALPMFHDAGWIVKDKLTVQASVVIAVDALLLSVLVRFAIEIRSFLLVRFSAVAGFGNMAASLVFLITTGIAYTDFKPMVHAWPDIKSIYLWSFFAVAAALLAGIVVLIFRDRDSIAALILRQPMSTRPSSQHSQGDESAAAFAAR